MNCSVIFEPTCPICHHIFEYIKSDINFRVTCPVCGTVLNNVRYPNFDVCYTKNKDGKMEFVYSKLDFY